jgi:hypothetical protein
VRAADITCLEQLAIDAAVSVCTTPDASLPSYINTAPSQVSCILQLVMPKEEVPSTLPNRCSLNCFIIIQRCFSPLFHCSRDAVSLPNRVASITDIHIEEDSPVCKLVVEIMGFSIFVARLGLPGVDLISYRDMINHGHLITEAISIPMSGDADNGYENYMHVKMRVKGFINAGFAGIIAISVKDEDGPEGIFTNRKAVEAHQFTMHVNFDRFSAGILVGDELVVTGMGADCHIIASYHTGGLLDRLDLVISPQLVATMRGRIWCSSCMSPVSNILRIGFHCNFFRKP